MVAVTFSGDSFFVDTFNSSLFLLNEISINDNALIQSHIILER